MLSSARPIIVAALVLQGCNTVPSANLPLNRSGAALERGDSIQTFALDMGNQVSVEEKRPKVLDGVRRMQNTDTLNCIFTITRRWAEDRRLEPMVSGELQISQGIIVFGPHSWKTGGMADSSYLKTDAILEMDENGVLWGEMPYFHLFVNAGEVALPPVTVTLRGEKNDVFLEPFSASYPFEVDAWQDGIFEISSCVSEGTKTFDPKSFSRNYESS